MATAEKLQKALDNKKLIVDSVNEKTGSSFDINAKPSDLANAIVNIETTPTLQEKTVIENGEVVADEGYDGLSKVVVNVESSSGENTLKKLLDYTKSTKNLFSGNTDIIDLTNYIDYNDTENVENMSSMFYNCKNLITIPPINTSKVTYTTDMFYGCRALTSIPQLDTSNVIVMNTMFRDCQTLTSIPQLDTSNVTNATGLFYNCNNLITIPSINTSKIISTSNFFRGCYKLFNIPALTISDSCTQTGSMFYDCYNLEKVEFTRLKITSSYSNNMFQNCYSLKAVIIREFGNLKTISATVFNNCYHLIGTIDETYNPDGLKDGYIYVPAGEVDTLKSATNWSTYADQIRALEDYTVDGTTTGELDESKVNA